MREARYWFSLAAAALIGAGPLEAQERVVTAGDTLTLSVQGHPDLTGRFVVNPLGDVLLPRVGVIRASGRSMIELERRVAREYARVLGSVKVSLAANGVGSKPGIGSSPGEGDHTASKGLQARSAPIGESESTRIKKTSPKKSVRPIGTPIGVESKRTRPSARAASRSSAGPVPHPKPAETGGHPTLARSRTVECFLRVPAADVFRGPAMDGDIIATLHRGETLHVRSAAGEWLHVDVGNGGGYVHTSLAECRRTASDEEPESPLRTISVSLPPSGGGSLKPPTLTGLGIMAGPNISRQGWKPGARASGLAMFSITPGFSFEPSLWLDVRRRISRSSAFLGLSLLANVEPMRIPAVSGAAVGVSPYFVLGPYLATGLFDRFSGGDFNYTDWFFKRAAAGLSMGAGLDIPFGGRSARLQFQLNSGSVSTITLDAGLLFR